MNHFNHSKAKQYCQRLGLYWDEEFAHRMDKVAHKYRGITQKCWDEMCREYMWKVLWMSTPAHYSWAWRIKIAAAFLNPFAKKIDPEDM